MPKKGPRPSQRTTSATPSLPTGAPVSPWMQAYGELRTAGWNPEQARRFATEEQKTGYLGGFLPTGVSQLPGVKAMTRAAPALLGKSETVSRMQGAQQMAQGAGVNLVSNIVGNVVGLGIGKLVSKGLRKGVNKLLPALERRISGIDPTSEVVYHGRSELGSAMKKVYSEPDYPFETPPHLMSPGVKLYQERLRQALAGEKLTPLYSSHPSKKGKGATDEIADILNPGSNASQAQKARALAALHYQAEPTTGFHAGTSAAARDTVNKTIFPHFPEDGIDEDPIPAKFFRYEIPANAPRGPRMFDNVQAIKYQPRTRAWLDKRELVVQNLERASGRARASAQHGINLNEVATPYQNVVEGMPKETVFEKVQNSSGDLMWEERLRPVEDFENTSWLIPNKAVEAGNVIYRGSANDFNEFPDRRAAMKALMAAEKTGRIIEGGLSQTGMIQNAALNSRRNRNKRR